MHIANRLLPLWSATFIAQLAPGIDCAAHFPLVRRANPCEPGGTPILYTKEYHAEDCPPKHVMNSDGSCQMDIQENCDTFCEVRTNFFYDQEVPVGKDPYCHGPFTCTLSESDAKTYTYSGSGTIGGTIAKALNLGVTGGFNYASAKTQLRSTSVNLNQGQCGYFSFLPELKETWYLPIFLPLKIYFCYHDSIFPFPCPSHTYRKGHHRNTKSRADKVSSLTI